jgi:hypothetical protein
LYLWLLLWHLGYTNFCVVLLCVFTFCISRYDVRYDFRMKTMFGSSLPPVVCRMAHVLFKCLFVHSGANLSEKVQKDKQRSTKHTHKTKDRVTRTLLKIGGELRCSGRISISCFTSGTRRVNLVTNPVISHEWGKDREVVGIFKLFLSYKCFIIVTI